MKTWVSLSEYFNNVECKDLDYNSKQFLEFRWALMEGLKKESELTLIPLLDDFLRINIEIQRLYKNSRIYEKWKEEGFIVRVLTTPEKTHIYGLIVFQVALGFFTKKSLSFPLTCLTSKSEEKDIFKLMKEGKRIIEELVDEVDYLMLETVLTDDNVIAHNKTFLKWFVKKYNKKYKKAYEVYVSPL